MKPLGSFNSFCQDTIIFHAYSAVLGAFAAPKWVPVTMATGFVWSAYRLPDFLWGVFNRFFQRLESCRPSSCLCLCENISTFGLPLPVTVYSLCCWGNDVVTSARRKAVWQLPLRIQTDDPVWESVWHCVRGAARTVWCAHLCRGRLWGSDDVSDTDAFQREPAKSSVTYFGGRVINKAQSVIFSVLSLWTDKNRHILIQIRICHIGQICV